MIQIEEVQMDDHLHAAQMVEAVAATEALRVEDAGAVRQEVLQDLQVQDLQAVQATDGERVLHHPAVAHREMEGGAVKKTSSSSR